MKIHIIAAYWHMINDRVCIVVVVAPPGSASAPHGLLIGNGNDGDLTNYAIGSAITNWIADRLGTSSNFTKALPRNILYLIFIYCI